MPDESIQPNIRPNIQPGIPPAGLRMPPAPLAPSMASPVPPVRVPVSPMAPSVPPVPPVGAPSPQMASPEQRQELLTMIEDIKNGLGDLNASIFAGKNTVEQTRRETLRRVFEILQLAGIDLTKRESVAEFLEKLRMENPELAGWFEESMDVLLGGEDAGPITPSNANEGMDLGAGNLDEDENDYEYETPNQIELPPQNLP